MKSFVESHNQLTLLTDASNGGITLVVIALEKLQFLLIVWEWFVDEFDGLNSVIVGRLCELGRKDVQSIDRTEKIGVVGEPGSCASEAAETRQTAEPYTVSVRVVKAIL